MRRLLSLLGGAMLARTITGPGAATEPAAVVVRETYSCNVGWDASWSAEDPACMIQNVQQPDGSFTEVIHGQIPADQMDEFRAAGSPSSYATSCLVNYGWLRTYHNGDDWGPLMVFTSSVRHFTPDGKMTEVCAPASAAVTVDEVYPCNVGWDATSGDLYEGAIDDSCRVTNVRTANGSFKQVLHGQIPAEWMDEFRAAGSPSSFATGCLVNYGWLMKYHQGQDWTGLMVFTTSVRHFTPDGKVTEVCAPSIP